MSNEPLDPENSTDKQEGAGETRVLNIDNLHLHANEIDSLRRLADKDPELARIVVNQKDRFSRRDHGSYRFGVVAAVVFILGLMVTLSFVLVELGLLLSLIMLVTLFIIALFVRVILTGEWSDTSAIGHLTNLIIKALGGKPKD